MNFSKILTMYSPLQLAVIVASTLLLIAFLSSIYYRLKISNFSTFSSLTLTNKYFVVSIGAGAFSISLMLIGYLIFPDTYSNLTNYAVAGAVVLSVTNWTCAVVGIFAGIYRYERIAMVLRGTNRYIVLQILKATAVFLAIFSVGSFLVMVVSNALQASKDFINVCITVYAVITGLSMAFDTMLDLALGIRMTILVLESVKKTKIVKTLKTRLLGTLAVIIAIDIAAVILIFQ